jgi:hypothetical protein
LTLMATWKEEVASPSMANLMMEAKDKAMPIIWKQRINMKDRVDTISEQNMKIVAMLKEEVVSLSMVNLMMKVKDKGTQEISKRRMNLKENRARADTVVKPARLIT